MSALLHAVLAAVTLSTFALTAGALIDVVGDWADDDTTK